jgi:hypothetical protein
MKVGKSIQKAINEIVAGDQESAMLHACNAVDGTAKKIHSNLGVGGRFTKLLRDNYFILGPMGMPGIDLDKTRFPVSVTKPNSIDGKPDLADVIYSIHRCTHGHGDELPDGFELLPDSSGPLGQTRVKVSRGKIQLSDRIVFGLVAVCVLADVNSDQIVPDGYHLTYGASGPLMINDWWGRSNEFRTVIATEILPSVHLDFTDWMDCPQ